MVFISAALRSLAVTGRRSCNSGLLRSSCVLCRTLSMSTNFSPQLRQQDFSGKLLKNAQPRLLLANNLRHFSSATGVIQFNLSDIGEGIREVEVKEWFVKIGQKVAQFDSICEVQSDKAAVTITSRYDGIIKKLYYEAGDKALVGKPLVDIELTNPSADQAQGSAPVEHMAKKEDKPQPQAPPKPEITPPPPAPPQEEVVNTDVLATPAVRRFAKEKNVNLNKVKGTGRGGRIMKEDILAAASGAPGAFKAAPAAAPPPPAPVKPLEGDRVEPLRIIQKAMFKIMSGSLSVPHFGYREEFEVNELIALRKKIVARQGKDKKAVKITFMPYFLKAASLALRQYPLLNAAVDTSGPEPKLIYKASHNIGIAMDTPDGLIVPVVKNVQNLTIIEIAAEINRLQAAGAAGKLTPSDLSGATFTLSNIGTIGATYAHPVLTPPQVCIGAIGKISRLPRYVMEPDPRDPSREIETVKPVSIVYFSWSCDHRVIDGATCGRFSNAMKAYIENPALMTLDTK